MATTSLPLLKSQGQVLDSSAQAFGELRDSSGISADAAALRQRMDEDGYLFLRGILGRDKVLAARRAVLERLEAEGILDPDFDLMEGVLKEGLSMHFRPDLAQGNAELQEILYSGPMLDFYERFLGGPILHFNFTWFRAVLGGGTAPHLDVVYMGRGTKQLYTSWVPQGEINLEMGGLIILENSHKLQWVQDTYAKKDVDSYCSNGPLAESYASGAKAWDGSLSKRPATLRERCGGRWLSCGRFMPGDLLVFGMKTIHASLDNPTRRLRLSSDSRYQLASEPADERWVGANPIGHGQAGKRGRIC